MQASFGASAFARGPQPSMIALAGTAKDRTVPFNLEAIVHDLCNQVQCAASAVGMLRARVGSECIEDLGLLVQSARSAIRGADEMISRLCDTGADEASGIDVVDVEDIVHELVPMLRLAAGENILLTCRANAQGHKLGCNVHDLEASILNLVLNARDAMPDGGHVAITADLVLSAGSAEPAKAHICLGIHDNGRGMPGDLLEKVCDPYVSTKARGSVRGLGLASVKAFVDASEGWLKIESEVGRGTAVLLYLPAAIG